MTTITTFKEIFDNYKRKLPGKVQEALGKVKITEHKTNRMIAIRLEHSINRNFQTEMFIAERDLAFVGVIETIIECALKDLFKQTLKNEIDLIKFFGLIGR